MDGKAIHTFVVKEKPLPKRAPYLIGTASCGNSKKGERHIFLALIG